MAVDTRSTKTKKGGKNELFIKVSIFSSKDEGSIPVTSADIGLRDMESKISMFVFWNAYQSNKGSIVSSHLSKDKKRKFLSFNLISNDFYLFFSLSLERYKLYTYDEFAL